MRPRLPADSWIPLGISEMPWSRQACDEERGLMPDGGAVSSKRRGCMEEAAWEGPWCVDSERLAERRCLRGRGTAAP